MEVCPVEAVSAIFGYLERLMRSLQQHKNNYFHNFRAHNDSLKLSILRMCNQARVCAYMPMPVPVPVPARTYALAPRPSGVCRGLILCCMQILQRISRTVHADLAARIMLLIARLLKPDDASGQNKMGFCNRTHPTPIEDVPEVHSWIRSVESPASA